ncbi:MAG: hypothetical protein WDN04_26940 [Rhodospirillales bacterium]
MIALEANLAAGPALPRGSIAPALCADPRRAKLQDAFRIVTEKHPDRAEEIRQATARADEELAADPDQTIEVPELLFSICEVLGIEIDFSRLPDEYLGLDPNAPPDPDIVFDWERPPVPRATSPR